MEGSCVDYAKIICETEEVKSLLAKNGIKDVNENLIFEKLERKAVKDCRVVEVVREIISETNSKEVDVIVIDDDRRSPEVEILVDLTKNFGTPVNEFDKVAYRAKEIFERERGVKRSGDSSPETSKRSRESLVCDLFEDSFPLEEAEVIEEAIALSASDSFEQGDVKQSVSEEANSDIFQEGTSISGGSCSKVDAEQKAENTGESTGQGAGDFLFNNINLGPGAFRFEENVGTEEKLTVGTTITDKFHLKPEVPNNEWVLSSIIQPHKSESKVEILASSGVSKIGEVLPPSFQCPGPSSQNEVPKNECALSALLQPPEPKNKVEIPIHPDVPKFGKVLPLLSDHPGPSNQIEIPPYGVESLQSSNYDTPLMRAQHLYLKAIFPHLDPSYLKDVVRQCADNERLLNEFIRDVFEGDLRSNYPVPSCTVTRHDQPCSSSNSFQGTSRQFEDEPLLDHRVISATEVPVQKEIQVDIVESSPYNEEAATRVSISAPVAESVIAPEIQEERMEVDASEPDKTELYAEQLEYLIGVLPDADPTFLEGLVRDSEGNQERLKDFVTNALDNNEGKPIYPTRGQSQQKKEEEALMKRFTDNFSVEDFLQVFPDPVGHFESGATETKMYHDHSMAYLRSKFRYLFLNDIASLFRKKNFSMTLTALDLSKWNGIRRKTKRSEADCKWPKEQSVAFLQEVAYLENRDKIIGFINNKSNKRQKAYEKAKENNELMTCGCCFDDELLSEDMSTCSEGHIFCKDCIKKGAEVIIGDGKSHFPCMDGNCKEEFTLTTLQEVLAPAVFGRLVQRLQIEEINAAGIEGLETCPFCPYSTIPAPDDKIFKCLNPECMKESCRECKELSHIPLRCDEVEKNEEVRLRTYIEDKMTEALVRTCWKCNKKFIKEDGCNKMTCTCGAAMCYICRQPVIDYKHFNPEAHRPSQLCPLYSDDRKLNFDAVKAEAERAKEEAMRSKPNVRLVHDPTVKLPEIPANPPRNPEIDQLRLVQIQYRQAQAELHWRRRHYHQGLEDNIMDAELHLNNQLRVQLMQRIQRIMPVVGRPQPAANAHYVYPPPPPRNHVPRR